MKWRVFHHPDVSIPVIRRKAGDELVSLLGGSVAFMLTSGRINLYSSGYPNRKAYYASIARLKKKGLIIQSKTDGSMPGLRLTPEGKKKLPAYHNPEEFWNRRWNGWWYVLMFDVPERNRRYRDTLRRFLKSERLGCLQRSVWVTPRDIRPEYDDLDRAAALDTVAFLFEAKTVLGYGNQSVVEEAWNFKQLNMFQQSYIDFIHDNLPLLQAGVHSDDELMQLLKMEDLAYCQSMIHDPLLPGELLPAGYAGKEVYFCRQTFHQTLFLRYQNN